MFKFTWPIFLCYNIDFCLTFQSEQLQADLTQIHKSLQDMTAIQVCMHYVGNISDQYNIYHVIDNGLVVYCCEIFNTF